MREDFGLVPNSERRGGGCRQVVIRTRDVGVDQAAVRLVEERERDDTHAICVGADDGGVFRAAGPVDDGCATRIGNRLHVLVLQDDEEQLVVICQCDRFPRESTHLQAGDHPGGIAERAGGGEQRRIFAKFVEIHAPEV